MAFDWFSLGLTIVDALDTAYIMGLTEGIVSILFIILRSILIFKRAILVYLFEFWYSQNGLVSIVEICTMGFSGMNDQLTSVLSLSLGKHVHNSVGNLVALLSGMW